jgi:acyl-CoA synthetase (NDP forming)
VPAARYPEDAARALARVVRHVGWRRRPADEAPALEGVDPDAASLAIAEALGAGESWLGPDSLQRLLGAYGIPMAEYRLVEDPTAAGHAADELGGKVALKAAGPEILHKSDLGAVAVGLEGGAQVSWEAVRIDERLAEEGLARERFIVQRMIETGVEVLIGVVGDAVFGPVIAFGAGGVQAELLKDVAVRIAPIGPGDAAEMIRSLATYPLLTGYRGAPAADIGSLEQLLLRLSAVVDAHHELAEIDLNPVIAGPEGAQVVDARVRIETGSPREPWPRTWR